MFNSKIKVVTNMSLYFYCLRRDREREREIERIRVISHVPLVTTYVIRL